MFSKIKNLFIVLVLFLVITQFLRPEKNEASYTSITTFEEQASVTPEIQSILQNQCYDCHSNTTRYPWFMEVSPISHWMAYHIEEGKEHFNVSKWEVYTDKQKDHKLEEVIEKLEEKAMPLESYGWIHGEISSTDAGKLIAWAKDTRAKAKEEPIVKDSLQVEETNVVATDSLTTNDVQ